MRLERPLLQSNERFREITGYSEAELLSTTFQELTHPDDLPGQRDALRRLLSGEVDRCSMEKRYLRKDGTSSPVRLTFSAVRRHGVGADTFIGIAEELAPRRRMEDEGVGAGERGSQGEGAHAHALPEGRQAP